MKVVRVISADHGARWYANKIGKDFKYVREYCKSQDALGGIFSGDGFIVLDHTKDNEECWVSNSDGYVVEQIEWPENVTFKSANKYSREIKPGVFVDCYDVIRAYNVTDPCLQHLIKKALAVGQRGHKDARTDYKDILDSAKRALEMFDEWNKEDRLDFKNIESSL